MSGHAPHVKAALRLLQHCARRHDRYVLFSDCMELMALAIANSVDLTARDRRETRYLEIVRRYDRDTIAALPRVLAEVTMALEAEPGDILGQIFTELEIHNSNRGQFFTPYPVCRMMAAATLCDAADARAIIAEKGYTTAMEPACGAGAMVIALAQAMREADINYQRHLHVTAVDIDPRAVHMAYIQFSLLHIPALVIVGNSLSGEMQEHWFTPAHILGGWTARLAVHGPQRLARSDTPPDAGDDQLHDARPSPPAGSPRQLSLF